MGAMMKAETFIPLDTACLEDLEQHPQRLRHIPSYLVPNRPDSKADGTVAYLRA